MNRFAAALLVALTLAVASCDKKTTEPTASAPAVSIEDYLVKNNEITGWTYGGAGWVANNISELTTHINGAAEIYQRHGFMEAASQAYSGTVNSIETQIVITVYNQASQANALAVYEDPDIGLSGAIDWDGGAGQAAHYARYGGLSQVMAFYRGRHFVYMEMSIDTEESLNILKQFALNVDAKINNR